MLVLKVLSRVKCTKRTKTIVQVTRGRNEEKNACAQSFIMSEVYKRGT